MKRKLLLLVCTICCISLSHAQWTQTGADIDGEAGFDQSGISVSLSANGTIVAIGANGNDGNGSGSGHVRVYQNTNGTWTQIGADIDGEASGDVSGKSISLSADGSIVAIGAHENDGNGTNSGHVRVYENVNGTWTQVGADIDGESAFDQSGWSVSLSDDGTVVAIGARLNSDNGSNAGHARIYKYENGTWTQIGADIDGEAADDWFGWSISLSGDGSTVAIGGYHNDGNGIDAGHVRVFKNINNNWSQIGTDIDGEAADDEAGFSVSLNVDGTIVAVGAIRNDNSTGSNSGHVRVFKNELGTWNQMGAAIDGEASGDFSGYSVNLNNDGSIVAIGAYGNDGNGDQSGHVRVYRNQTDAWIQVGADIDGEDVSNWFGASVSLSDNGSKLAVGAFINNSIDFNTGHTRVFENPTLSVEDVALQNLTVYPNPASTTVFVQSKTRIETITIFDTRGTQIKTMTPTEIQGNYPIDVSDLATGFYFMTLQSGTSSLTKKFMKN